MTSFTRTFSSRRTYVSAAALIAALLVLAALVATSRSTNASAQPANVSAQPTNASPMMTWHATVSDAATGAAVAGAIFVDDVQYCADSACAPVTAAEVPVLADGQKHKLRVEAAGYRRWEIEIAGQMKHGRRVLGPVKLNRAGPPQQEA